MLVRNNISPFSHTSKVLCLLVRHKAGFPLVLFWFLPLSDKEYPGMATMQLKRFSSYVVRNMLGIRFVI